MSRSLPTELLALIAQDAAPSSQAALARTCKRAYTVSIKPLYASIRTMGTTRTTQCLRTLAYNLHLARLVRIYAVKLITSGTLGAFSVLVTRALENMENLTDLSIQLGVHATSAVLASARFKLTRLVCVIVSDRTYPVARFLESQPGIESLYVVCREDGMDTLAPDALPVLHDVAAPLRLLPHLIPTRLDHITRISILGTLTDTIDIHNFANDLYNAPTQPAPGTFVDLVLGLNLFSHAMRPDFIASALSILGISAPWIGLLRLEVHHGRVSRRILKWSITHALAHFPNLHTLVIMSQTQPASTGAYIHSKPSFPPPIPYIPPFPPHPHVAHPTSTPTIEPDALYDIDNHPIYLTAWRAVHPGLQKVVFPIGVYTYARNVDVKEDTVRDLVGKGWGYGGPLTPGVAINSRRETMDVESRRVRTTTNRAVSAVR